VLALLILAAGGPRIGEWVENDVEAAALMH
jgi:hypothetical protein